MVPLKFFDSLDFKVKFSELFPSVIHWINIQLKVLLQRPAEHLNQTLMFCRVLD